jgi:hypothetical protein
MRKIILSLLILNTQVAFSQQIFNVAKAKPELLCFQTDENIQLDGKLNETCWKSAAVATDFIQIEPSQGERSHFRTEVAVIYNSKAVYISFICYDTLGKNHYRAPDLKRDFEYLQHDMVAIAIDGFNDYRNSMTFATNVYGAQKDYLSFDDTYFDSDWNGLWTVRTSRTDSNWIAEFEIPWKTLRYKKMADGDPQTIGINFFRLRRNSNEISVWAPYPRSFGFNRMEYAGVLTGLKPPKPSSNIQVNPYSLLASGNQRSNIVNSKNSTKFKMGGEAKWAITPNLVADATINTDFAQADADVQVNNLSRLSIFFPEKRQFFLENASLFGPGLNNENSNMTIQPFFSRRVGLDDNGSPIPIEVGGRIVYRSTQRNFGVMYVRQQTRDSIRAANFIIGRYSQNIGRANHVGVVLVSKMQEDDINKSVNSNVVGGVDGFFRIKNAHSINFMLLESGDNGTKAGYSGFAQYLYTTNFLQAWLTESFVSRDFNAQAGFISRGDVINTSPGLSLNVRGKWLPTIIRSYAPALFAEWYHQQSTGVLLEKNISFIPLNFVFSNGGSARFSVFSYKQYLPEDFKPLGVVIDSGNYKYTRQALLFSTNGSRKISGSAKYEWGKYYNGNLSAISTSLLYAPTPFMSIKLSVNSNRIKHAGKDAVNKEVNLYTVEGRFAVNPQIQLTALYQRNSLNNQDGYNIRMSWEYKPLSYIYLVWNKSSSINITQQQQQTGIIKVSYLRQF